MNINGIHLIDNFYRHYCNGQWEHDYGITIQTCDNPGWLLTFSDSKLNEIWNESTCGVIIKRISDKHNVIVTYKNERHTSFQEINIFFCIIGKPAHQCSRINKVCRQIS